MMAFPRSPARLAASCVALLISLSACGSDSTGPGQSNLDSSSALQSLAMGMGALAVIGSPGVAPTVIDFGGFAPLLEQITVIRLRGEAQCEVLLDRHPGEQRSPFRDVRNTFPYDVVRRLATDRLPGESDRAGARGKHPGDHAQRRRLAGAVRAEQRDDFAVGDGQRHAM